MDISHSQQLTASYHFDIGLASNIKQPLLQQVASRLQQQLTADEIRQELLACPVYDASVLVAITNEEKPKVLLTRRASHIKAHAGEVAFAGGKYEDDDGNNVITALRESHEETNLNPDYVQVIGRLPTEQSKAGLSVCPIVAIIEPNQVLTPEQGEIAHIFWADLAWLIDTPTEDYHYKMRYEGKPITLLTPSWQVEGETVWGLTGRIIASMLGIGFDKQIDWYYRPMTLAK